MIESLTKEQEAKMAEYRDAWIKIGLAVGKPNKRKVRAAINKAYAAAGLKNPADIIYFDNPIDAVRKATQISVGREKVTATEQNSVLSQACYGQHDAGWLAYYSFFKEVVGLPLDMIDGMVALASEIGWWWALKNTVVVSERPSQVNVDDRGRLHSITGPAVVYGGNKNGPCTIYSVHGVVVGPEMIEDPNYINPQRIDGERNAEVRRVMIEMYGLEKYVTNGNLELVDNDKRWGILYKKQLQDDEVLTVVLVKNSTPEPDGSIKNYVLRVPPAIKTAKEGVAWTFNCTPDEYDPRIET
jgi:hypothetical protein